ncbi:hypothetical protein AB0D08_21100 [Kitasatospora sp. NPDC048540]|uniref:hypothetical protein n=1 Tax=unclassified Kitasatospora TaxID=2633591 RepID=UPI00053A69DF|nr:hypothetical protein [Kitasatospora sp. MBT63]
MKVWQAALKIEGLAADERAALQFNMLVGELALIANGKSDTGRLGKMIRGVGMETVESACMDRGRPDVADFCRTVLENSE